MGRSARPVLAYNAARFGLFAGCAVLGYLAGLRGIALIAAALLVSGVLSWFVLARQRAALAQVVDDAVTRSRERFAARTAAEDAYVDALARQQQAGRREAIRLPTPPAGEPAPVPPSDR